MLARGCVLESLVLALYIQYTVNTSEMHEIKKIKKNPHLFSLGVVRISPYILTIVSLAIITAFIANTLRSTVFNILPVVKCDSSAVVSLVPPWCSGEWPPHSRKVTGSIPGSVWSLHVHSSYSGFFPQSKNMNVRWIVNSKSAIRCECEAVWPLTKDGWDGLLQLTQCRRSRYRKRMMERMNVMYWHSVHVLDSCELTPGCCQNTHLSISFSAAAYVTQCTAGYRTTCLPFRSRDRANINQRFRQNSS